MFEPKIAKHKKIRKKSLPVMIEKICPLCGEDIEKEHLNEKHICRKEFDIDSQLVVKIRTKDMDLDVPLIPLFGLLAFGSLFKKRGDNESFKSIT